MRKELTEYLQKIDALLTEKAPDSDWEQICREHLIHIQFFQHERLIHLIVTVLFALLAFATVWILYFAFSPAIFLLMIALFVLLIPYIRHYYFLENGVQKLYLQYDKLTQLRDGK